MCLDESSCHLWLWKRKNKSLFSTKIERKTYVPSLHDLSQILMLQSFDISCIMPGLFVISAKSIHPNGGQIYLYGIQCVRANRGKFPWINLLLILFPTRHSWSKNVAWNPHLVLTPSFLSKKEKTLTLTLTFKFYIKGQSFCCQTRHFQNIIQTLFFEFFLSELTWNPVIPCKKIALFVYLLLLQIIFNKRSKRTKNASHDFALFFKFQNIDKTRNKTWNKKFYCCFYVKC